MPDETADSLFLEIPADPEMLSLARIFAASVARHHWCEEETVEDVKVAISEACTSAIHAHRYGSVSEPVRIRARFEEDGLVFEVEDRGGGTELEAREPDATPAGGLYEGGLGLTLIRSLFAKADVERSPGVGSVTRFVVPAVEGELHS